MRLHYSSRASPRNCRQVLNPLQPHHVPMISLRPQSGKQEGLYRPSWRPFACAWSPRLDEGEEARRAGGCHCTEVQPLMSTPIRPDRSRRHNTPTPTQP